MKCRAHGEMTESSGTPVSLYPVFCTFDKFLLRIAVQRDEICVVPGNPDEQVTSVPASACFWLHSSALCSRHV